jgi:hypothetical protein
MQGQSSKESLCKSIEPPSIVILWELVLTAEWQSGFSAIIHDSSFSKS